ncbi:DUF1878 family protein [Bacillus sp. FJAT-50079]|nr:DUF1878 family protein [Bacillus sp. FJAT-50079]
MDRLNIILERLARLEYHQKLLLNMMPNKGYEFDQLIIKKNLNEKEVIAFHKLCEEMIKEKEKEKADHYVYHTPLFRDFVHRLNPKLNVEEVIDACIKQNMYVDLMRVFQKNI